MTHAVPMARTGTAVPALPIRRLVVGRFLGTVVVTLHGELDVPASAGLARALHDLIEGQGNLDVAVNLRDVRWIGEEGVQALAAAAKRLAARGGELRLGCPSPMVLAALNTAGLTSLLTVGPEDGPPPRQSPGSRAVSVAEQRAMDAHPAGDGWYRPSPADPPEHGPLPHPGWESDAGYRRHQSTGDD